MRIRLSGSYANFTGNILGADFTDGIGEVTENVANILAASLGGIMEVDENGDDVGPVTFDPRGSLVVPEIVTPRTESTFPVDVDALFQTVTNLSATVADLDARVTALEGAGA